MKTTILATGHYLNSPLFVTDEMLQDCLAHMPEMLPVKDGELGARLVGVMRHCRWEENRIVGELELVPGLALPDFVEFTIAALLLGCPPHTMRAIHAFPVDTRKPAYSE